MTFLYTFQSITLSDANANQLKPQYYISWWIYRNPKYSGVNIFVFFEFQIHFFFSNIIYDISYFNWSACWDLYWTYKWVENCL